MPWTDHIKVAATNIRRGALSLNADLDQLHRDYDRVANDARQKIAELDRQVNECNRKIADSHTSGDERVHEGRKAAALLAAITDTKHQMQTTQQQITDQIRAIENQQRQLDQQAIQLERQAAR